MKVLGIESSCDETSASVVKDTTEVLSNVVASQDLIHAKFGGVVPELASRRHMEIVLPVIKKALKNASVNAEEIDAVAVTKGPGLIGSLLVGLNVAKSLSYCLKIPLIGVNHLHAHLCAVLLEKAKPSYPCIGMIVSGGHTSLYKIKSPLDIELLGKTRDDAAGEAFDKVSKILGLGYPGGIQIEKIARGVDSSNFDLPRPLTDKTSLDFSFSGLKTAVLNITRKTNDKSSKNKAKIASSFQEACIDTLIHKITVAVRSTDIPRVIVCGGVAANQRLREKLKDSSLENEYEFFIPGKSLCTDNAAMIACAGSLLLNKGLRDNLALNAYANLEI